MWISQSLVLDLNRAHAQHARRLSISVQRRERRRSNCLCANIDIGLSWQRHPFLDGRRWLRSGPITAFERSRPAADATRGMYGAVVA